MARLARWDAATAGRVDRYVAISQYVAGRIRRYYNREADRRVSARRHRLSTIPTQAGAPSRISWSCRRWSPTSASTSPSRLPAGRRAAEDRRATDPNAARLRRAAPAPTCEFSGWSSDEEIRDAVPATPRRSLLPGEEDFGIVPVEAQACGRPVVALGRGGALETVIDGETGVLVDEPSAEAFADGPRAASTRAPSTPPRSAATPKRFSRDRFAASSVPSSTQTLSRRRRTLDDAAVQPAARRVLRRHRRAARHRGVHRSPTCCASRPASSPSPRACRRSRSTQHRCRSSALLVPLAFQVQGLYRLRRGRSRVDDFFARLRRQHPRGRLRHRRHALRADLLRRRKPSKDVGALRSLAAASGCSSSSSTSRFTYASRELVREVLERRWRAGIGLKRVLIAGAGDLGRLVADKVLEHRELGFKVVGFLDDGRSAITSAIAACRCSARWPRPTTSSGASASITCTSRCRSKST